MDCGIGGVMGLVKVAYPETAVELAVMVSLLEAEGIPFFVHGAALGTLHPGPLIANYNTMTIMVPEPAAEQALEALTVLREPPQPKEAYRRTLSDRVRMVVETLFFGWFVPGPRQHPAGKLSGNQPVE